ncbi:unnamed protein product, partial [Allacma fusca]
DKDRSTFSDLGKSSFIDTHISSSCFICNASGRT